MAHTIFKVSFRLLILYLIALIVGSIYQAISPMSDHNRGKIVDHGAEYIQYGYKDLQSVWPGFDYFVQTMYQVIAQTLLTMAIRYSINTAVFTGVFIAFALCSTIVVLAESLFLVVWLPVQLVMGLIWLIGNVVSGTGRILSKISPNGKRAEPRKPAFPKFSIKAKVLEGPGYQNRH